MPFSVFKHKCPGPFPALRTFYHTARFAATIRHIFGRIARATNDARTMKKENELTLTAILLGIAISVVFGAANAYLGLRVGLKSVLGLISASPLMDCVRYFVMSFVAIAVYPLLFKLFKKRSNDQ